MVVVSNEAPEGDGQLDWKAYVFCCLDRLRSPLNHIYHQVAANLASNQLACVGRTKRLPKLEKPKRQSFSAITLLREVQREVTHVIENWNATNDFICYGR